MGDLGDAVGRANSHTAIDECMISALPASSCNWSVCPTDESGASIAGMGRRCTICQETMCAKDDIRVLPCGHEYHYTCIAQWIPVKNSCCVCQSPAIIMPDDSMLEK